MYVFVLVVSSPLVVVCGRSDCFDLDGRRVYRTARLVYGSRESVAHPPGGAILHERCSVLLVFSGRR